MKETVFTKNGEENKVVSKKGWNWWGFIFGWLYFAYKKDFLAAAFMIVLTMAMIVAIGEDFAALFSIIAGGYLANHRLHKFYLDKGYVAEDPEDQEWIAKNIKGCFGRA